ncbi:MAG TPA: NAD(P)/FAD-dependent oxidoreductase [Gemmataceae bacterium]|nr:NAD(P)/FAD-dependent oxidoreductase [Gemmataceae bacterium]
MNAQPQVVIVGGGFGGLSAARALNKADVRVTLVDRRNFHLFQPLLYQVATGQLSPANIAAPLRSVVRKQKNTRVILADVVGIDTAARRVLLADGTLDYDVLILATGARHHYFGKPEWEKLAPGLKTVEDATEIRRRVLSAFEQAERETDPDRIRALLTFVIVGAGATGVELAGAVCELARHTLRHDFRNFDPRSARVILLEGSDRVLPALHPKLSAKATRALAQLGATVRTQTMVTDIQPGQLTVSVGPRGEQTSEKIDAHTVLWAAGVQGSRLGKLLADSAGAQTDRAGRVIVQPDLTLPGHPELFVIGDLASCNGADGKPLPGVAPVAMQQGRYVANLIRARLKGKTRPRFVYKDKGSMATIGRARAVADLGWVRFNGYLAWLAWLFIHLMYIVGFQNRLLVLMQWAWNYVTRGRSSRLITERDAAIERVERPA